jgi:hypothetical protein
LDTLVGSSVGNEHVPLAIHRDSCGALKLAVPKPRNSPSFDERVCGAHDRRGGEIYPWTSSNSEEARANECTLKNSHVVDFLFVKLA